MRVEVPLRVVVLLLAVLGGPAGLTEASPAETAPAGPSPGEVEQLRAELVALQKQMAELRERIDALSAPAPSPPPVPMASPTPPPEPPPAPGPAAVPVGSSGAEGSSGALPVYGNVSAGSKVFNPDIAVVGDFLGAAGDSAGEPQPASLELHEAELSLQAVVDPYARADFFLTFGPDEVGVEEGFVTFPTLPGGLLAKVGKMRDAFGRVNAQHNHVLSFADRPLVTENLTGGEEGLADYGFSLARLIPVPGLFLEATAQVYRGQSEVFAAPRRQDLAYVGHLRAYRDLGESSNLDLGGSLAYGTNENGAGFHTRLLGADLTYRWRPLRRAIYQKLLLRTEIVFSRRDEPAGPREAFGLYASGEYQFARRFYLGGRFDYSDRATGPDLTDKGGSFLLGYRPSEWSELRGQYRHTRLGDGTRGNEFLFQLLFAIGAHGAHPF